MCSTQSSDNTYYILTPDRDQYQDFESRSVHIVDVPRFAKSNLAFAALYHYYFPKLIKENRIDAILNYGDIVIPGSTPQLYNFDWPHAAYPNGAAWARLPRRDRFYSTIKLWMFKRYLSNASIVMAQTDVMAARLRELYALNNIEVVPNAVSLDNFSYREEHRFGLPGDRLKLLYLTYYYPHKNLEVLLDVARLIRDRGLDMCIITTIAAEQHPSAAALLERVAAEKLESVFRNIGPVPMERVAPLYEQCDALLMPTLLESFSGSYVEAMFHKRPIITSDLEFARGVCADAAIYVDPLDPVAILDHVQDLFSDGRRVQELVLRGTAQLSVMWDWARVFSRTQALLGGLVDSVNRDVADKP
jgi:glycosyltransferase involved in cell wall biosynthesis